MPEVALAVEDALSEAIGRRLVSELGPEYQVGLVFRKGGFGYLKTNMKKFAELSRLMTVLLITDLDQGECAPALVRDWMRRVPRTGGLLFRVAIREVESWLLADQVGMKQLLGTRAKIPPDPDQLNDPKKALLTLARNAPRDVRLDLLPKRGALASQGLGYNQRLSNHVETAWSPERAAARSDSLERTRARLRAVKG